MQLSIQEQTLGFALSGPGLYGFYTPRLCFSPPSLRANFQNRRHVGQRKPCDGCNLGRRDSGVVGGGRGIGLVAAPVGRAGWGARVMAADVLYGLAGMVAVLLFAYLVFALICAEEF